MSMIGKSLAHYSITGLIGKGGMGEVYQAKDHKLGRDVAIKVLPEEFARDPDRVARFQREAKLLASLNHPNIASIYGLEESGGTNFLIMELIEGETLADRISGSAGVLAGKNAAETAAIPGILKIALQIAEALEAAHEKGVIHRDLKPANIKVTPEGNVKVLDFGLAKAYAGDPGNRNLSNSPTLSDAATQQGVILGTAAYMPPEQAKGKSVDKRADIWAFGVVLFEMLAGRQLFTGDTVSETLAAVLMRDPDFSTLPADLHPKIREMLERCLEKDPRNRYSGISDARVDIKKVLADPRGILTQQVSSVESQAGRRSLIPWAALTVILIAVAGTIIWHLKPAPPPEPKQVTRFVYELPEGQQFNLNQAGRIVVPLAVSPDGSQFVYGTTDGLYLRSVDALSARLIAGTDKHSRQPQFSPDGQWICYWSTNDMKLKKVAVNGGAPIVLCDAGTNVQGIDWAAGNTIIFSDPLGGGIKRISADGGTPELLVKGNLANIKEGGLPLGPQMLPDGQTLLYSCIFDIQGINSQITAQSLESGKRKVLVKDAFVWGYVPSGHLIYSPSGVNTTSAVAVPFDPGKLEITGGQVSILEGVLSSAVSDSGTLIYVSQPSSAAPTPSGRTLVWVDRNGKEEALAASPDMYSHPNISPDGTKLALTLNNQIWLWDLDHETLTKLTFKGTNFTPVWTPDGKRIAYGSMGDESVKMTPGIYWKAADGAGEEEQLVSIPGGFIFPYSWSRDGKFLVGAKSPDGMSFDVWMLSSEGDRVLNPLLQEDYLETQPRLSPNGQWIAFTSRESGRNEVYVHSFPDKSKGRWLVSSNGGDSPLWSPDGRELYYFSGNAVMAISVTTDPGFSIVGAPKKLFQGPYACPTNNIGDSVPWDISPDGKRFLMIRMPEAKDAGSNEKSTAADPRRINIVLNWFEELKAKVPAP
jgi:serine/threonine protein kinase/Tol biopolymer transport system component